MTKTEIDDYFTTYYTTILKTAKSQLYKNSKLYIQPDVLINNLYIFIIERTDIMNTKSKLESCIYNYIRMESYWTNGKSNLQEKMNDYDSYDTITNESDVDNIEDKFANEQKIQDYKYILESFYQSLDFEDKRVYEMYFHKKLQTSKLIADHLEISKTSGYKIIKKFRDQMQQYIKTNYKDTLH